MFIKEIILTKPSVDGNTNEYVIHYQPHLNGCAVTSKTYKRLDNGALRYNKRYRGLDLDRTLAICTALLAQGYTQEGKH